MQPVKLRNEVERPLPSHLGRVSLVVAIQWPQLAPTGPNTCFLKATPEVLKQLFLEPRDIDPSSLNDHSSQRIRVVTVSLKGIAGTRPSKIPKAAEVDV